MNCFNEKKPTILTIDDEKILRDSFQYFLEDLNYNVITADNGSSGLEIINTEKPDLILLDLRMPVMNGLEVLKTLSNQIKEMPVIVISGNGVVDDVIEALRLGAWDYILKPVSDMSIVNYAITKSLERSRLIKENKLYQQDLEKLVTEKTKELSIVNDELKQHQNNLEKLVNARTQELIRTQKKLVENAHKSGMADIATDTLHNVGNLLNNVMTSSQILRKTIHQFPLSHLKKANSIFTEVTKNYHELVEKEPKFKELANYYSKIEEALIKDEDQLVFHIQRLENKIKAITEVIVAQQSYAGTASMGELLDISSIIEDALIMQHGSIEKYDITLEKNFSDVPLVNVNKTKLVHILINLLKNAKDAIIDQKPTDKKIIITIRKDSTNVYIDITDNGIGIEEKNLVTIFSHGFTTKKTGHGFGLHSCANYIREMDGQIKVTSQGLGKGSTFTLSFPQNI